jgi:uncharacterized protein DUF6328
MVDQDPEGPDKERGESEAEREDRKWDDILQELRVIQTGTQLTAGFLLTLPFQQRFEDLSRFQHRYYLALVLLAAVVTALVLTPIAIHRRLAGRRIKGRLVASAHVAMQAVLASLGLLLVGITGFIFDVVVSGTAALVAAGSIAVVLVALLVVVPRGLVSR